MGVGELVHEWPVYRHLEMKELLDVLGYVYERKRVGVNNSVEFIIHTKEKGHNEAHLHARYQGKEVVLGIPSGNIIEGDLKGNKAHRASLWVQANAEYLKAQWDELTDGVKVFG